MQTVVLGSNADGLAFALRRGFLEVDRYVLDGDSVRSTSSFVATDACAWRTAGQSVAVLGGAPYTRGW